LQLRQNVDVDPIQLHDGHQRSILRSRQVTPGPTCHCS
jgi:hypothetical protein